VSDPSPLYINKHGFKMKNVFVFFDMKVTEPLNSIEREYIFDHFIEYNLLKKVSTPFI
jgi:hypothetical protein